MPLALPFMDPRIFSFFFGFQTGGEIRDKSVSNLLSRRWVYNMGRWKKYSFIVACC
jgi:hypothetical protein